MSNPTNKDLTAIIGAIIALLIIGIVIGNAVGATKAIDNFRNEAVKMGHAEWRPNEFGSPTFTWKKMP